MARRGFRSPKAATSYECTASAVRNTGAIEGLPKPRSPSRDHCKVGCLWSGGRVIEGLSCQWKVLHHLASSGSAREYSPPSSHGPQLPGLERGPPSGWKETKLPSSFMKPETSATCAEVDFCRRCQSLPSVAQRMPWSSQKAHTAQRSGPSQPSHHPQVMLPHLQHGLAPRFVMECWWSDITASV